MGLWGYFQEGLNEGRGPPLTKQEEGVQRKKSLLLRLLLASECTQLSCYYCHHLTPASSVLPHRWKIISPQYSFRFSVGTSKASSRLVNCAPIYFSDSSADSYYGTTQTDLCQDSESSFITYTLFFCQEYHVNTDCGTRNESKTTTKISETSPGCYATWAIWSCKPDDT